MAHIATKNFASIMLDGRTITVHNDHPNWSQIYLNLLQGNEAEAFELADVTQAVAEAVEGTELVVCEGEVLYHGEALFGGAVNALLDVLAEGERLGVKPYVKALGRFLERVQGNPSMRARQDLYTFLEVGGFTILPDGRFAAYKKVRRLPDGNLVDIHSGKFDNNVGAIPTMPRRQVDDDPTVTCSKGLHVCSQSYLPNFGGSGDRYAVVYVAVDPADVVAIPVDYNNAKMRVSKYEVLGVRDDLIEEATRDLPSGVWSLSYGEDDDLDEDYDEDEDFDDDGDDGIYYGN